jgi:hypothetical protein
LMTIQKREDATARLQDDENCCFYRVDPGASRCFYGRSSQ